MSDMHRGMTLIEVLIGTALLTGAGGALLMSLNAGIAHSDYLAQLQIAVNAAQGQLERIAATDFATLRTGVAFQGARTITGPTRGQCIGLGEDTNCNNVLDEDPDPAGLHEDLNDNDVLDEPLPGGRLSLQIHPADSRNPVNPSLLDLYVSVCWTARGRKIGEDTNCNGVLDPGEDLNGNGLLDSPVMLSTRIAIRE